MCSMYAACMSHVLSRKYRVRQNATPKPCTFVLGNVLLGAKGAPSPVSTAILSCLEKTFWRSICRLARKIAQCRADYLKGALRE